MAKKYWLLKCEPSAYSIEDLERDGRAGWEGVRNYQARNLMRDQMKAGDEAIFYASNADPSGATGVAKIVREGYPDPFQFQQGHEYFDPESGPDAPRWFTVDVAFVERFASAVTLGELRDEPSLAGMVILRKGNRLSVTPLTADEFKTVRRLGRAKRKTTSGRESGRS